MFKIPKQCSITLAISGVLLAVANAAQASTYTGAVGRVLAQPSTIAPSTQTRFSIVTASSFTTACTTAPGTYSFDLSNAGLASVYEAILISAVTSGAQVVIDGSGVCDAFGIEEVASIWLQ
jgi:hypothetical protein